MAVSVILSILISELSGQVFGQDFCLFPIALFIYVKSGLIYIWKPVITFWKAKVGKRMKTGPGNWFDLGDGRSDTKDPHISNKSGDMPRLNYWFKKLLNGQT